jgi:phosphoglucosamine mutase
VDEKGRVLNGDHILAICAKTYKDRWMLRNNVVVTTVMNNFGLVEALKKMDIRRETSNVGDRYVLEKMKQVGAVLGGESSGHIIFLNHHTTGDGIIAALQLLAAMKSYQLPLSSLSDIMTVMPQVMINVDVAEKPPIEDLSEVREAIESAERELDGRGRVLVRYSGTQSLCRVMVEGPDEALTRRLAESLADTVRVRIG